MKNLIPTPPDLTMISSHTLAAQMGYTGPTAQFRAWLKEMDITPIPGRRGVYDPKLVRARLDAAQRLREPALSAPAEKTSLVASRKARRNAH